MNSDAAKTLRAQRNDHDAFQALAAGLLAMESLEVIWLRLAKLSTPDGAACREARLMVDEKVDATFEAMASLQAGASAAQIVDRYRQHVAANARRLQPA